MPVIDLPPEEIAVIPAVQQVTASKMWITDISIRTPGPTSEGSVEMNYIPMTDQFVAYSKDTDGNSLIKSIRTEALYADIELIPALKTAFGAILQAVPIMLAVQSARQTLAEAQRTLAAATDEETIASATEAVTAAQAALNALYGT